MRAPLISASRQGLAKENQRKESEQNSSNSTKTSEDPSKFLEKIYQAYRHYTNTDPEAPENIRTVNLTFFWRGLGNTLQQEKVAKISALGMNLLSW